MKLNDTLETQLEVRGRARDWAGAKSLLVAARDVAATQEELVEIDARIANVEEAEATL